MAPIVSRRSFVTTTMAAIAVAGFTGSVFANEEGESAMSDTLMDLLKESMASKRGVTVVVEGSTIALVVTSIDDTYVVGRNQQYDKIVVRLSEISAAYM